MSVKSQCGSAIGVTITLLNKMISKAAAGICAGSALFSFPGVLGRHAVMSDRSARQIVFCQSALLATLAPNSCLEVLMKTTACHVFLTIRALTYQANGQPNLTRCQGRR